jgi:predicted Zn finger-like uncharacterized protein
MLIKCPKCTTTYKVSDEVLKGTTPAFRCSRCKHTFELQGRESNNPNPLRGGHSSAESNTDKNVEAEFSFRFPAQDGKQKSLPEKNEPSDDFPKMPPQATPGTRKRGDEWAMEQVEANPETPFTISAPPEWDKNDDFVDPHDDDITDSRIFGPPTPSAENDDNVFTLDPYRDQQASTLPYMTLFALLIICFSLLTALHITYPEASEAVVKEIPLIGTAVVRNGHLKDGLALKSIHGAYQTIQCNRDVFVVTGIATNENPVAIREVRLGGQIYTKDGKSIEEQSMWVGNALSPNIIRGMTPQDISDLQRLKPLKSFEIPPGDSIPFTIVFLRSGKAIKEFSCEVLGTEGDV